MSAWARYIGALAAGLVVTTWAWLHGPFDGLNLLVIAVLLLAALVLWLWEHTESQAESRDFWIDPKDGA